MCVSKHRDRSTAMSTLHSLDYHEFLSRFKTGDSNILGLTQLCLVSLCHIFPPWLSKKTQIKTKNNRKEKKKKHWKLLMLIEEAFIFLFPDGLNNYEPSLI